MVRTRASRRHWLRASALSAWLASRSATAASWRAALLSRPACLLSGKGTIIALAVRGGNGVPAGLDLLQEREHLVEGDDIALGAGLQQASLHVVVQVTKTEGQLTTALLVQAHPQVLDDADRLAQQLALTALLPAL